MIQFCKEDTKNVAIVRHILMMFCFDILRNIVFSIECTLINNSIQLRSTGQSIIRFKKVVFSEKQKKKNTFVHQIYSIDKCPLIIDDYNEDF